MVIDYHSSATVLCHMSILLLSHINSNRYYHYSNIFVSKNSAYDYAMDSFITYMIAHFSPVLKVRESRENTLCMIYNVLIPKVSLCHNGLACARGVALRHFCRE